MPSLLSNTPEPSEYLDKLTVPHFYKPYSSRPILDFVTEVPAASAEEILDRVLNYDGEKGHRKVLQAQNRNWTVWLKNRMSTTQHTFETVSLTVYAGFADGGLGAGAPVVAVAAIPGPG